MDTAIVFQTFVDVYIDLGMQTVSAGIFGAQTTEENDTNSISKLATIDNTRRCSEGGHIRKGTRPPLMRATTTELR